MHIGFFFCKEKSSNSRQCTNLYKCPDVIFQKPHAEIQKTYFVAIKKQLQLKTTKRAARCSLRSCSQRTTESSAALICLLLQWFAVFHALMDFWLLLSAKRAPCFTRLKVLHSEIKESSMWLESFEKQTIQTALVSVERSGIILRLQLWWSE